MTGLNSAARLVLSGCLLVSLASPADLTATPTPNPSPSPSSSPSPNPSPSPSSSPSPTPTTIKPPPLVTDPTKTYTYRRLLRELRQLAAFYPTLIRLESIGQTVSGKSIPLVKLGNGRREILVLGAEHAREHVSTNFIMRSIDTYAQAATSGQTIDGLNVRRALKQVTFYFVPQLNIDGVALVTGQADAKQRRLAHQAVGRQHFRSWQQLWKANARGVDLNRNYPVNWRHGRSSPGNQPAFQFYKGPRPASEPEVQAVVELAANHRFEYMLTMHTSGQVVYYRDRYSKLVPKATALAKRVRQVMGYPLQEVGRWDPQHTTDGGASANWFRHTYRRPALTIELTPYSQPYASAPKHFQQQLWQRGKALFLHLL